MTSTLDFLYLCLGIGFLVLVGFISYACYNLAVTVKTARETLLEVKLIKESVKIGLLAIAKRILEGRR